MRVISTTFKFDVGDIVYFSTAMHCDGTHPIGYVVTDLISQTCHGGTQRVYKLEGADAYVAEVALTAEKPPYRQITDGQIEDRIRIAAAAREQRNTWWQDAARNSGGKSGE